MRQAQGKRIRDQKEREEEAIRTREITLGCSQSTQV